MIEITPYTLKLAYRKLKSYYHYYHSSFYLKQKIIDFENNINKGILSFESLSNELNNLVQGNTTSIQSNNIGFRLYPKKNSFKNNYGKTQIEVERVNAFIEMDLSFHLVDVLFSLMLFEKTNHVINNDVALAGIKDERLSDLLESNSFLFKNYRFSYKKWKAIPRYCHDKNPSEDLTIVKTDIKNCFSSMIFNVDDIFKKIGLENNNVTIIMKSIFRLYSDKVFRYITKHNKEKNECCLPVGLLSSSILLNYLFSEIDECISNSSNIVLKYGRYADDIIIVFKGLINKSLPNLLIDHFDNVFSFDGELLTIKCPSMFRCNLILNKEKSFARFVHNDSNLKPTQDIFDFNNTSYIDYDDDERDNDIVFLDGIETLQDIRKNVIMFAKSDKRRRDEAKTFFRKLTDIELLNSFPIWTDIFKLFPDDREFDEELKNRILFAINGIGGNDYILNIKSSLETEFADAYKFSMLSSRECNYLLNITPTDIVNCIERYLNGEPTELFPKIITIAEISLYYATQHVGQYNFPLFNKTIELYKKINNVSNTIYYDINVFKYSFKDFESKGIINITSRNSLGNDARVALCALCMNDLEKSVSLLDETPKFYDLYDLENLLYEAKRDGAEYILLPEFAIIYDWILPLVKVARNIGITLISGITHTQMYKSTDVINMTLLFEHNSGMVVLKPKNYMPPEEIHIIEDVYKLTCYLPKAPLYYIVNDGLLCYSISTCYEITNAVDRTKMLDRINMLFLPVYNHDTNYFSSIIESFSRDASCFVGQANANNLGDTRLRQPTKHVEADIVKIKGGLNNYLVVGKLETKTLLNDNISFITDRKKYIEDNKDSDKTKHHKFKPLSAGDHHFE